MKKAAIIILTGFLIIGLTACGGDKGSQPAAPYQGQASAPASWRAPGEESLADLFAKAKRVDGLYYEYAMTAGDVKVEGKTWTKDKKIKNEMASEGNTYVSFINFENGEAYTYIPEQKMAVKMDINKLKAQMGKQPSDYACGIDLQRAKVVETTTYNGMKCKAVVITDRDGKEEMKMWISEEYGLPLRVESNETGVKNVMEYKNLKVGPLPDDTFKLPEGIRVINMGS